MKCWKGIFWRKFKAKGKAYKREKRVTIASYSLQKWYRGRESNPYERCGSQDFKSCVSTSSTTLASVNLHRPTKLKKHQIGALKWSERRGSNPRPQPWQGCALPAELLSHFLFVISVTLSLNCDAKLGGIILLCKCLMKKNLTFF